MFFIFVISLCSSNFALFSSNFLFWYFNFRILHFCSNFLSFFSLLLHSHFRFYAWFWCCDWKWWNEREKLQIAINFFGLCFISKWQNGNEKVEIIFFRCCKSGNRKQDCIFNSCFKEICIILNWAYGTFLGARNKIALIFVRGLSFRLLNGES